MSLIRVVLLLVLACWPGLAAAHEVRPALLTITEQAPDNWSVVWKEPLNEGRRLALEPVFGPDCPAPQLVDQQAAAGAFVTWLELACRPGTVAVAGLERTITDVMVRVVPLADDPSSQVLRPGDPPLDLRDGSGTAVSAYFGLGVTHLLGGLDHVLFVLGLLLLVVGLRRLVLTITAFTVAHSLTLAAATLGWLVLPARPVEACIALSLVLLAVELVRAHQARAAGQELQGLAQRPWLLAFAFGLLHGLGFAGVLGELGLPQDAVVWALLLFNLGVEAGQLMVVAAALGAAWLVQRSPVAAGWQRLRAWPALEVALGAVATFWMLQRLAG